MDNLDENNILEKDKPIIKTLKEEADHSIPSETSSQKREESNLSDAERKEINQLLLDAENLFPEMSIFDEHLDEMELITQTFQAKKEDYNIEVENFLTELKHIKNDFLMERISEMKTKFEFFSEVPTANEAKVFVGQINEALSQKYGLNYDIFEEILLNQPNSAFMAINISRENFPKEDLKISEASKADVNVPENTEKEPIEISSHRFK